MTNAIRKGAVYCGMALAMLSACSFADTVIKVTMQENAFQLSSATAKVGTVTFDVTNPASNKMKHEMVVIKTDLTEDKLPIKGTRVDEDKLKNMGETHDMKPGKTKKLKLKLPAGHYILMCNVPGHYASGMHSSFTVEP